MEAPEAEELFGTAVEKKDVLDKATKRGTITDSGANFVRKALDPFHDFRVRLDGLPDTQTSESIVQEVSFTQTISAPVSGQPWDLHVFTLPDIWDTSCTVLPAGNSVANEYISDGIVGPSSVNISSAYPFGMVNCVSVPTGSPTTSNGTALSNNLVSSPFSFASYIQGQKRLIGLAFEAHDVTADLYRQGSVICYRMPQSNSTCQLTYVDTSSVRPCTAVISRAPPAVVAEARLIPDSTEWKSAQGAYCVATMDIERCDISGGLPCTRYFSRGDLVGGTSNPNTNSAFGNRGTVLTTNAPPALSAAQLDTFKPTAFHTSGAYFIGLNASSQITVTVKALFESMPTPDNPQLVVLAQPSPDYDPIAIELYKRTAARMPAACPVGMNASGDFWEGITNILEQVLPTLPGGAILAPAAKLVKSSIQSGVAAQNKKKKDQKTTRTAAPSNYSDQPPQTALRPQKKVPKTSGAWKELAKKTKSIKL